MGGYHRNAVVGQVSRFPCLAVAGEAFRVDFSRLAWPSHKCVVSAQGFVGVLRLLFLPRSVWLQLQTFLVDCTGFLPGSPVFAAFYKMGPVRRPVARGEENYANSSLPSGERDHRQGKSERYFGLLVPEVKDFSGGGSDTSVSSG